MSGPKIIHVVTREELIARCEAHLRRLDTAIAEWKRAFEGDEAAKTKADQGIAARRDALHRLLREGRFNDVQKQVPAEISFLQAETHKQIERRAAAAAKAIQMSRRTARTARMLLEALSKSAHPIPQDLQRDLQSSTPSESTISQAFALLAPAISKIMSEKQRELALKLGHGEQRLTFEEWLTAHPIDRDFDLRIDNHLAELTALGVDPSPFAARAAAIIDAPPARQALLADSLIVELASAVKDGRDRSAQLAELRERAAELAHHDSANALALRARIDAAIAASDISSAPTLIAEADPLFEEKLRVLAADARRRAVLTGLATLGYEVNEGMATAWVQGGQVVLRKAANPDYGVELGGGTKSDRLQVRAVAFGNIASPRNPARDRDMEAAWCSEFERLRTFVSANGGGVEIERALAVGVTPLKIIEDITRREEVGEATTLKKPATLKC